MAFCGEPSRYGDRISAVPKRGALALAPLWRGLMGAGARPNGDNGAGRSEEERLERVVDVHAFTPAELGAHAAAAGLTSVRVCGEELAASLFGWVNRTLEATAEPSEVPWAWRVYAYRGYLLLQRLDGALLEPRLPAALFYNLLVSARAPVLDVGERERRRGRQRDQQPVARGCPKRFLGRGRGCLELGRLGHHPGEHRVQERHGPLWHSCQLVRQRPSGRGQAALRRQLIEHRARLGRARHAAKPAERAPRHLAQPLGARGAPEPGGRQDEQGGPGGAPQRGVEAEPAAEGEEEGAAGEDGGEYEAGGERLAVGAGGDPGDPKRGCDRGQQQP